MGTVGLAVALFVAAAGPARAQEPARAVVLLAARAAPPDAVRTLAARLGEALGASDAAAAIDAKLPEATPRTWNPAALLAKAAAGRDDYFYGRFARAADLFAEVRGELAARIDRIGADEAVAAALFASQMMHAIALVRTGRDSAATEVLAQAHGLFPGRRPTVTEFGPELVQLWSSAIRGATAESTVRVIAMLGRRPCVVRWNGREVGPSPAVLEHVSSGPVVLSAACGDVESRLRRFSSPPTQSEIRIDVGLDAAIETTEWVGVRTRGEEEDARSAARLGAAVGASRVAILAVTGPSVEGRIVDIDPRGRETVVRHGRATVASASEMARLVDVLTGSAGDERSAPIAEEGTESRGPAAATRGAVWWITGAAGTVAASVGGILLVSGRSSAIDALSAESASDRADAEKSAASGLTVGAYLLPAGIGAALAAATLYFLPADGRGTFRGPLYAAMLVSGAVAAAIGASLLLQDGCESFDPLCPAQGSDPGPSTSPVSFTLFGLGLGAAGAAVALRAGAAE